MAARTSRNRRTTDWIEDLTAWALIAAGMLLIVVSVEATSVATKVPLGSLTAAAVVLGFGAAVLAGLWIALPRATLAYICARWEREWRAVKPIWSGGEDRRDRRRAAESLAGREE